MNTSRALILFCVICVVGLGFLMIIVGSPTQPKMEHNPAVNGMVSYTIQEIDGCEYIVYASRKDGLVHLLIHKANCKAH